MEAGFLLQIAMACATLEKSMHKQYISLKRYQAGFTLVELLIVIVVIAILAAITVIAYNGIQTKAHTTVLMSDLNTASEILANDNAYNGAYPLTAAEANGNKGLPASPGTSYTYTSDGKTYCLTATSTYSGVSSYYISSTNGAITSGQCTVTDPTPQVVGHTTVASNFPSGGGSLNISPDGSIATGDWMILTYMGSSNGVRADPPGWTRLSSQQVFNTQQAYVWGRIRQAGDTNYTFTASGQIDGIQLNLIWGTGADPTISDWIGSAGQLRSVGGVSNTNTAPSITTTTNHTLSLVLSFEATITNESDVTSLTGATNLYFAPQQTSVNGGYIQTLKAATIAQATAGPTGDVTIVYPNAQASNGFGVQIGIPGV